MTKDSTPTVTPTHSGAVTDDILRVNLRVDDDPSDDNPHRLASVSWTTSTHVTAPRVLLGTPRTGYTRTIHAKTRVNADETTGAVQYTHRARLTRLSPDSTYIFLAACDGSTPVGGAFRTDGLPVNRRLAPRNATDRGRGRGSSQRHCRPA